MRNGEEPLGSWKAIARFLGRDVRTAMRWERAGMPVHRVPRGGRRGPVFAYASELDAWLHGGERGASTPTPAPTPTQVHSSGRRWAFLALGILIGAGAVVGAVRSVVGGGSSRGTPPEAVSLSTDPSGTVLRGLDVSGGSVWELAHPDGRAFQGGAGIARTVGGHGGARWIIAANVLPTLGVAFEEGELFALAEEGGRIEWRRRYGGLVHFGAGPFGPPWISQAVAAGRVGSEIRVFWVVRHHTWWPSVLRAFGESGEPLGEFVNAGWIQVVQPATLEGRDVVLLGGISNARRAAMMAVLRGDSVRGSSPEDPGSPFACSGCGDGGPERYVVFEPSEVSRASALPYNRTLDLAVTADGIQVVVQEGPPDSDVTWVYTFSHDLETVRASPGDTYWVRHDALFDGGDLDHPAEACPERTESPAIRAWTRSAGWSAVRTGTIPVEARSRP